MGWYTELFCNITFNKETYNTKDEVLDRIDDLERYISVAKSELRDLVVMTEPSKFSEKDEDPYCWLINTFNSNLELLEEYTIELYKLNLLLSNWNACHTKEGLAIDPPEGVHYDSAFLSGDFVNSVKYPDSNKSLI